MKKSYDIRMVRLLEIFLRFFLSPDSLNVIATLFLQFYKSIKIKHTTVCIGGSLQ